jgi:hypothetical protein
MSLSGAVARSGAVIDTLEIHTLACFRRWGLQIGGVADREEFRRQAFLGRAIRSWGASNVWGLLR